MFSTSVNHLNFYNGQLSLFYGEHEVLLLKTKGQWDDDVAKFGVCICVNKEWVCSCPDSIESELDLGAEGMMQSGTPIPAAASTCVDRWYERPESQ